MPADNPQSRDEHTYPREWYRVSRWSERPEPRLFQRETDARLYWHDGRRERFENKYSRYSQWLPTLEEAQAVIDERKEREAERAAADRVCKAAPELLDACQRARRFIENGFEFGYITMPDASTPDPAHDTLPAIIAAISKATSRQPEGER